MSGTGSKPVSPCPWVDYGMDALMARADQIEWELSRQIPPLVEHAMAVVFDDLATVRIHGAQTVERDRVPSA